jgi:microsomal dipeptidase-like Zn-dependent dipeptidase
VSAGRGPRIDLPRVDLHSHACRCFLAGLPPVLTLVHYRVSEIGDVQTEAPVHDGLSRFGRDVVAECNRLGIVVDCAHASFATTMAVLEASSQPVIISHDQLDDLAVLLRDRGLPSAHVHQILGGNAMELLGHVL